MGEIVAHASRSEELLLFFLGLDCHPPNVNTFISTSVLNVVLSYRLEEVVGLRAEIILHVLLKRVVQSRKSHDHLFESSDKLIVDWPLHESLYSWRFVLRYGQHF